MIRNPAIAGWEEKMRNKILISILIGLFVLTIPQVAKAQFGKNMAVKEVNWKIYETPHFEIYYYFPNKDDWEQEKEYIQDMVRWTETAYKQISEEINYDMPVNNPKHGKPPVFFYWSRYDALHHPLGPPPGASAFAEPGRMRAVHVSKESPDEITQQIVTHEVTHLFQYSLWKLAKKPYRQLIRVLSKKLSFLFEGWAQHTSRLHKTEPRARLILRYWVLNGGLRYVNVRDWPHPALSRSYEICYVIGGYFFDFIKEEYGAIGFKNFVTEFRRTKPTARGFEKVVTQVLKTDFAELDRAFRKYLEDQYKHLPVEKKEALEYGRDILVQRNLLKPEKKVKNAFESVISPSEDLVAAFTVKKDNVQVALISVKDGTIVKTLSGGYSLYKYGLYPIADLHGPGRALSFSPDGDYVLYFAQTAGRHPVLVLIGVVTGKVKKKIKEIDYDAEDREIRDPITGEWITVTAEPRTKTVGTTLETTATVKKVRKIEIELDDPESPEMSKDGRTVIFSAIQNGQRDIFSLNLETKEIENLTNDEQFDYGPSFAPDEKTIVYVTSVANYNKLFSLDLATGEKKQLTFGLSNEIRPIYSKDGKTIWFISDQDKDKTKNIYSLDVINKKVTQWTDVINGVRTVVPMKDKKMLLGAVGYRDSRHPFGDNLYEVDLNRIEPAGFADNLLEPSELPEKTQIEVEEIDPEKIRKYKTKFHFDQGMFYGSVDTRYGVYGWGSLNFSNLTATKYIQANVMKFGKHFSYNTLSYFDISRRIGWGAVLSSENRYFRPWFVDWGLWNPYGTPKTDPVLYYLKFKQTKLDATAWYPLDLCHRLELSLSGRSIRYQHPDWLAAAADYASKIETAPLPDDPIWQLYPEGYREQYLALLADEKGKAELRAEFLDRYINDGKFATLNFAIIRDTALFKPRVGAFANDMYRIDFSLSTGGHNARISTEFRKYFRLGSEWTFALRGYAGTQWGNTITPWIIGDLGELRGYKWMQFMGNQIMLANAELRFPLVKNFNLLGIYLGDIRAALFMDVGKIGFDDARFNLLNSDDVNPSPVKGSVGIDLELGYVPFIGMPVHIAFSKRMTKVKLFPKLEKEWQIKIYFGYSF